MHDHLRNHAQQKVLDQSEGEAEVGPVVAHLQDLETVALEIDIAIEVLLVESLHGDLLAAIVLVLVLLLVELDVGLDGLAGELGLLVLAGGILGGGNPESGKDREIDNQSEENPGLEAAAELVGDVGGDTDEERKEGLVVEVVGADAICGQRSVGNRRILCSQFKSAPEIMLGELNGARGSRIVVINIQK